MALFIINLSDRQQVVLMNSEFSDPLLFESGVPQAGIPRLVLSRIYVIDWSYAHQSCLTEHYWMILNFRFLSQFGIYLFDCSIYVVVSINRSNRVLKFLHTKLKCRCRWLEVNIYISASQLVKYPP